MNDAFEQALKELSCVMKDIDPQQVERAVSAIAAARKIMLYGCGREGLQMQGLAMRLHHLGLAISMQGDMAAPPLGPGDLFIVSAGPGELPTVSALMGVASKAGAAILFLTAEPDTPSATYADTILVVPAQTMARDQGDGGAATSILPMGSLYEGAMFVLFEIMVLMLKESLSVPAEAMRANHTNME